MIRVDETTIYNWENNRVEPAVQFIPRIIKFLGYCPYTPARPLSERLTVIRQSLGLSRERMAQALGVDESTLAGWEAGRRQPLGKYLKGIKAFLAFQGDI